MFAFLVNLQPRPFRRMAVALAYDNAGTDIKNLVDKAKVIAAKVKVN
jgi:hypothetical protein